MRSKRYQVVTYCDECGIDEKMDFNTLSEAFRDAGSYQGKEDAAAVYDYHTGIAYAVFGLVGQNMFSDAVKIVY